MIQAPQAQLAFLLAQPAPTRFIVTGEIGQGKTTWCMAFVDAVRQRGLHLGGVLSPPVFKDGHKTGIDLVHLRTNERRRLAQRRTHATTGILTRSWAFDPDVLAWGNEILADVSAVDVLLIDELGQIEFEHNAGWQNGLQAFDGGDYRIGVVVIRPWLLEIAQARWPDALVGHAS